jgi:Bacterial Ig domain
MLPPLLSVAVAVVGLTVAFPAAPAAHAVTGGPPATTPDAVTVLPANTVALHPVNNDHDPDNDLLALCRLGTEHYKALAVDFFGDELDVFAKPHAKPGTYTFTYYACDYSYLVPGTVTVTVKELPEIAVKKITNRPGALRVTNTADMTMRFLYGSFNEDQPDGSLVVAKGDTVVIAVHRTRIDWIATSRRGDVFLGSGHVTGIKLNRPAGRHTSHVALTGRLADAWRTA